MSLFNKEPLVIFKCKEDLLGAIPNPVPASEANPKWLRKMAYKHGPLLNTVKKCVPFTDAMDMGYILPLWIDLEVVNDGKKVSFRYKSDSVFDTPIFENHNPKQIEQCPIAKTTYGDQPMKFLSPWLITTPPGWSCMFIQPINHFDGRLHIITGVVDTDKYKANVHFPFVWADRNFSGVIPQGTPLVQVIPFRRADWTHKVGPMSEENDIDMVKTGKIILSTFSNAYRLNWWTPKRYK